MIDGRIEDIIAFEVQDLTARLKPPDSSITSPKKAEVDTEIAL